MTGGNDFFFTGYIDTHEGKVPFENRRRAVSNMAATDIVLNLVSVDFKENDLAKCFLFQRVH